MKLRKEIIGQKVVKHKNLRFIKKIIIIIIIPSGSYFQERKEERTNPERMLMLRIPGSESRHLYTSIEKVP